MMISRRTNQVIPTRRWNYKPGHILVVPLCRGPSSAAQSMSISQDFSRGLGTVAAPPYTGPPHGYPRYSGTRYPDMLISESILDRPTSQTQCYFSTQANNSMANQGYNPQAYPYVGGHSSVQPGVYSPPNSGYPAIYGHPPNYGQMSCHGDAARLNYEWPEGHGSR
jgi:hypothetical protein